MQSLRQAFNNAWQASGPTSVCDMCPLHHLHQLCVQLEGKGYNFKVNFVHPLSPLHESNLKSDKLNYRIPDSCYGY